MTDARATMAAYEGAISRKDTAAATAMFSEDALVYDLAPPLSQPPGAARDPASLEQWFATWDGPIVLRTPDLHVETDGDLAVATGLRHLTGTKVDDGPLDLWFRGTTVLRRDGDAWRIIHVHESVPFAMDGSGKVLLDLQPEDKQCPI